MKERATFTKMYQTSYDSSKYNSYGLINDFILPLIEELLYQFTRTLNDINKMILQ